jgi:hypothetical protein
MLTQRLRALHAAWHVGNASMPASTAAETTMQHDPRDDARCDAFGYDHECEGRKREGDDDVRSPAGTKGYPEPQPIPRKGPAKHRLPESEAPHEPQNSPKQKPFPSS